MIPATPPRVTGTSFHAGMLIDGVESCQMVAIAVAGLHVGAARGSILGTLAVVVIHPEDKFAKRVGRRRL